MKMIDEIIKETGGFTNWHMKNSTILSFTLLEVEQMMKQHTLQYLQEAYNKIEKRVGNDPEYKDVTFEIWELMKQLK